MFAHGKAGFARFSILTFVQTPAGNTLHRFSLLR